MEIRLIKSLELDDEVFLCFNYKEKLLYLSSYSYIKEGEFEGCYDEYFVEEVDFIENIFKRKYTTNCYKAKILFVNQNEILFTDYFTFYYLKNSENGFISDTEFVYELLEAESVYDLVEYIKEFNFIIFHSSDKKSNFKLFDLNKKEIIYQTYVKREFDDCCIKNNYIIFTSNPIGQCCLHFFDLNKKEFVEAYRNTAHEYLCNMITLDNSELLFFISFVEESNREEKFLICFDLNSKKFNSLCKFCFCVYSIYFYDKDTIIAIGKDSNYNYKMGSYNIKTKEVKEAEIKEDSFVRSKFDIIDINITFPKEPFLNVFSTYSEKNNTVSLYEIIL